MDRPDAPSLMIIRAWREDGSEASFRAQIRIAAPTGSGPTSTISLADPDRVLDVVRSFLERGPIA